MTSAKSFVAATLMLTSFAAEGRAVTAATRVLLVHFCDQTGLKPSTVRLIEREIVYRST